MDYLKKQVNALLGKNSNGVSKLKQARINLDIATKRLHAAIDEHDKGKQ